MKGTKVNGRNKWEVEEDLRTLVKSKEIMKDKKRMASVRVMAQEKIKAIKSVA